MKKQTNAFCSGSLSPSVHLVAGLFKKMLFSIVALLVSVGVFAQQKLHVTGIVNDEKGSPAVNASVTVKGTKMGVTTDVSGAFSIDVPNAKSVLAISSTGFESQEIVVGNKTNFNVGLKTSTSQLNEVVVVG
jgi:hypothetical protein